jgi:predicted ester cyclase
MNTNDPDVISNTIDELVEPNAVIRTPLPLDVTGAQALKEVFVRLHRAYPDLHVSIEDLIAEGGQDRQQERGYRHPQGRVPGHPTLRQISHVQRDIHFRFVNGQVAEIWGVVDVLSQLRQLGAMPS